MEHWMEAELAFEPVVDFFALAVAAEAESLALVPLGHCAESLCWIGRRSPPQAKLTP